jgi:transposase
VRERLPEDHLVRFVVERVDRLDRSQRVAAYAGTGSRPYPPAMLVARLFYGYATGLFSSRKLAQATYDSIAFRYLCANTHPDHRTIADFPSAFSTSWRGYSPRCCALRRRWGWSVSTGPGSKPTQATTRR